MLPEAIAVIHTLIDIVHDAKLIDDATQAALHGQLDAAAAGTAASEDPTQ